ncbi:hypothetical protein Hanom_Chr12g01099421 [Helianthus anomalus]
MIHLNHHHEHHHHNNNHRSFSSSVDQNSSLTSTSLKTLNYPCLRRTPPPCSASSSRRYTPLPFCTPRIIPQ